VAAVLGEAGKIKQDVWKGEFREIGTRSGEIVGAGLGMGRIFA
jgi:hypothetical protein